jgi:prevent-host-death family protein
MKSWRLSEAKNNFGQLVRLARTEGPQAVLQNGKTIVLVVAPSDLRPNATPAESVLAFFAPLRRSGIQLCRRHDLPRKVCW